MAAGYNVVVLGPYPSKAIANNTLASVSRCVPDAYITLTAYAGE
jgi:hypothetical protein